MRKKVTEEDYIDCITGGEIKVHHLAALACDIPPLKGVTKADIDIVVYGKVFAPHGRSFIPGTYAWHYLNYVLNHKPFMRLHNKLKIGLEQDKLQTTDMGYNGFTNLLRGDPSISINEGIDWLEKEGVAVSGRLKEYVTGKDTKKTAMIHDEESQSFVCDAGSIVWDIKNRSNNIKKLIDAQRLKGKKVDDAVAIVFKLHKNALEELGIKVGSGLRREYYRK